ncbi:MAG: oligosaccharide flippase family protein [Geopsychrobacter sp.]|nr:oligosaccharide flippase family protein [Geopsychrobacter sp.]
MINGLASQLIQIYNLFRFKPFDVTSPEGRSQERLRRILLSAMSSALAKATMLFTLFISVPLTLNYLGVERFGLWMVISSTITMLSVADLGIGNGLMNAIAEAHGKNDVKSMQQYFSSAVVILSIISVAILVVFFFIYPHISWGKLFNVKSILAIKEAGPTVAVFVVCFALNVPVGIVQRVQMGLQMGARASLWEALGNFFSLLALLFVVSFGGGLPWLVGAMSGGPLLSLILNSLDMRFRQTPSIFKLSKPVISSVKKLTNLGVLFFVLQISGIVAFQADNLIIAHYLGAESVATYSVTFKLFSIPPIILGFFIPALWPAYAEASSRGDKNWVRDMFTKSLRLSLWINLPLTLLLVGAGPWIISKWAGDIVAPSFALIAGLGLWSVLNVLGGNFSALLNGLHIVRFQVITASLMAVANIGISIYLVKTIGVSGAVYGSVVSLIIFSYIPASFFIKKLLV